MSKDKYTIEQEEYIKAVKRADRENELRQHGKLISTTPTRIVQSKKVYNRKKLKNISENIW